MQLENLFPQIGDMMLKNSAFTVLLIVWQIQDTFCDEVLIIDDSQGLGRQFNGIGAISGGGATSKLLMNYPEKERNEILDYLFKPNFAASLHLLKVEIGGDAQSTEGTEASHMHVFWEENYQRGYEWWLMKEAKKRNPAIKLYALPWAFPGWVGKGRGNPYKYRDLTAMYVLKWIIGAKEHHNLTIDYVGIWNEKEYDVDYILLLRQLLNKNGFDHIKIVAADGHWEGIVSDIGKNETLAHSVDFIGAHYPGTKSTPDAVKTGIPLWASEDYSTVDDNVGAGCWARLLNQNYLNGMMTGTIGWNLIAAYYRKLPFGRAGLMTAEQPWSGYYVVSNPIWVTAHTTQFTQPEWYYLKHSYGVGRLPKGGSYASLVSPDKKDFTLIIETMSHDHSICVRPFLPSYDVQKQNVTFKLKGSLASSVDTLYIWHSQLNYGEKVNKTVMFKKAVPGPVYNGTFSLFLDIDSIVTVTTVATGNKGMHDEPPSPKDFPLPYHDNFEVYPLFSEANNFAQQVGAFEIQEEGDERHNHVLRQMVLEAPIHWCTPMVNPVTLIGNIDWANVTVQADVLVPKVNGSKGVFIAARLNLGGCLTFTQRGIYFVLYPGLGKFNVFSDLSGVLPLKTGAFESKPDTWYTMILRVTEQSTSGYIDGRMMFSIETPKYPRTGFVGLGTEMYGYANFDNFSVRSS